MDNELPEHYIIESRLDLLERELLNLRKSKEQRIERTKRLRHRLVRWGISSLSLLLVFGCVSLLVAAEPPLTYSGYLEDNGQGITGNRRVELSLWSDISSKDLKHRKCAQQTPKPSLVKGRFAFTLNASCTLAIRSQHTLWAQFRVWDKNDKNPKLLRRSRIGSVPYTSNTLIHWKGKRYPYSHNALYVGVTPAGYDGSGVKGWLGAKAKCAAAYGATAHMCTSEEILRSLQLNILNTNKFPSIRSKYWFASSSHNIYKPSSGKFLYGISCEGWTNNRSDYLGMVVRVDPKKSIVYMEEMTCQERLKIACCQ